MGDDREWQKQLLNAALMAAARSAIQYITHPDSRDEAVDTVKSRLAEVDYSAAGRAVSDVIDRIAESGKAALNEAIDSIRENAEVAVEAAAEKAQEQLGSAPKKRGKGKLFFGILLGVVLGFVLLNEDRRNQLMDRMTGATGPVDSSQWSTVASNSQTTPSAAVESPAPVSSPPEASAPASAADDQATQAVAKPKAESKKAKAGDDGKKDDSPAS
ncbi:MAG TPA: hypothetical protein VG815_10730 [Chloroflexota bacterium]|jgi:hypothetical protein|nr:hypothetical protein [Chloroflexota bacterium]